MLISNCWLPDSVTPAAVFAARKSGDPQKVKLAVAAENWLKGLDVEHGDLDRIRNRMIQWILALKK